MIKIFLNPVQISRLKETLVLLTVKLTGGKTSEKLNEIKATLLFFKITIMAGIFLLLILENLK